jgi:hypothetical protein
VSWPSVSAWPVFRYQAHLLPVPLDRAWASAHHPELQQPLPHQGLEGSRQTRYGFGSEPEAAPAPARHRRPGRGAPKPGGGDRRRCPELEPSAPRALAAPQRFSKTPTNGFGLFSAIFPPPRPPLATWFPRPQKRPKPAPQSRFQVQISLGGLLKKPLAGMDGNRTHLGRLSTAPRTVLKTAEGTSPRTSPLA